MDMQRLTAAIALYATICSLVACRHKELYYTQPVVIVADFPEGVDPEPVKAVLYNSDGSIHSKAIIDSQSPAVTMLIPAGKLHICAFTTGDSSVIADTPERFSHLTLRTNPSGLHHKPVYGCNLVGRTAQYAGGDTLRLKLQPLTANVVITFLKVINDNEAGEIVGSFTGLAGQWSFALSSPVTAGRDIPYLRPIFDERNDSTGHTLSISFTTFGHLPSYDCPHSLSMNYILPDGAAIIVNPDFNPECEMTEIIHRHDFTPGQTTFIDIDRTLTIPWADSLRGSPQYFVEVCPFDEPPIYIDVYN